MPASQEVSGVGLCSRVSGSEVSNIRRSTRLEKECFPKGTRSGVASDSRSDTNEVR
jgi:hypothetical protein